MDIDRIVLDLCKQQIFPLLYDEKKHIKIQNILLYGSRAENKFYQKSDFDLVVVVDCCDKIDIRFDGCRCGFEIDLQIFDKKTLRRKIDADHLSYAINLQSCLCVYGDGRVHKEIMDLSSQIIDAKVSSMIHAIKDDEEISLIGQLEHQMKSYNNYFNSKTHKTSIAYNGRLYELLYDYIRLFIRLYCLKNNIFDKDAVKLLLCIESFKRHSCYLEVLKKDWFSPVTKLIKMIDDWSWQTIKQSINVTHLEYFGHLIISDEQCQDLLLIKHL